MVEGGMIQHWWENALEDTVRRNLKVTGATLHGPEEEKHDDPVSLSLIHL